MLSAIVFLAAATVAGAAAPPAHADDIQLTKEFLDDPDNIAAGKKLWQEQCALCHGQRAYPGKGPKLKPSKYEPDFVFKRITKGFRGMPSWESTYDERERMSITAWVMSKGFKN